MTEKLPENVEKTLQILAERFGTTVEHLWSVAVRQTYIDALTALILIVATTVGAYFILKLCKRLATDDDSYMGESNVCRDCSHHHICNLCQCGFVEHRCGCAGIES